MSLPLHNSACSADTWDFLPPLIIEERSFCDLRRISLNISNQQCGKVIENAILGFNTQQQTVRGESYRKQETIISQQAKLLPQSEDTKFSLEI